jgi:phenylalanyl-tRNA synthetase alpha chain
MSDLKSKISDIHNTYLTDISNSNNEVMLDEIYLTLFSKKNGVVTDLIKKLASLDINEKKELGPALNKLQDTLKEAIEDRKKELIKTKLSNPLIDLTYPEKPKSSGMLHPITQVIREMNSFFRYYGFSITEGPEIETEEYNFRKLNLPEGHPATDLQDTLYVKDNILLTTHTSSIEARVLTRQKPPIRVAFPGKCYRNETVNSTNAAFFHQYQGLAVDEGITIEHLKGILERFHQYLFGDDVELRFRYKYYPEVTPGLGVDLKCQFCNGKGCDVCRGRGWIEVLGSGMVHPNILKMCGIDHEKYTGFAFGMGLDRLVMQRFGIDDIRKLYGGIVYK